MTFHSRHRGECLYGHGGTGLPFRGFRQKYFGVLVEASNFSNPGGWKIDTQFYQQMGGAYLLAHGMGKPVANATTRVDLPGDGKWKVWVRTRNWCPGDWEAPGRFKVKFDGKLLEPEFGTESDKWG